MTLNQLGEKRYGKGAMGEQDPFVGKWYKFDLMRLYRKFPVCPEIDMWNCTPAEQDYALKKLLKAVNLCEDACRSYDQKFVDEKLLINPVYRNMYAAYAKTAQLVAQQTIAHQTKKQQEIIRQYCNQIHVKQIVSQNLFQQSAPQKIQTTIQKVLPYVDNTLHGQFEAWVNRTATSPQGLFIVEMTSKMIQTAGLSNDIKALYSVFGMKDEQDAKRLSYGGIQNILNNFAAYSPKGADFVANAPQWISQDSREEMQSFCTYSLTPQQEQWRINTLQTSVRDSIIEPSRWNEWIGSVYEFSRSDAGQSYAKCMLCTLYNEKYKDEIPSPSLIEARLKDFGLDTAMRERFEEDLSKFGNVPIQYDITPEQTPRRGQTIHIYQERPEQPSANKDSAQVKGVNFAQSYGNEEHSWTNTGEIQQQNFSLNPFAQINAEYQENKHVEERAVQVDNWNYNLQSENRYDDHFRVWNQPAFSDDRYPSQEPDIIPNEHTQLDNQMYMQPLQETESSEHNPNAFVSNAYSEEEDGYDDVGDDARNFDEDGWEEEYDEEYDDIPVKRDDDDLVL